MRLKIVLGRWAVPMRANLPNCTFFVARYERISWTNLPGNIFVSRTKTIGPRNRWKIKKKKVFPGKYTNKGQDKKNRKI